MCPYSGQERLQHRDVRVLVLTGTGRAFWAGIDLAETGNDLDDDPKAAEENLEVIQEITRVLRRVECERVQFHGDESEEEVEEVEWRVHHLENDLRRLAGDLRQPSRDVARAARKLAAEVRRGCDRLRIV